MNALPENIKTIHQMLLQTQRTIASAESVTVGHLQSLLAAPSGASKFFEGGITVYNLTQKVRHLGVDRDHAAACYCVSERVALEMARGACRMFETDFAISSTGYAGPYPEEGVSEPFAYIAIVCGLEFQRCERITAPAEIEQRTQVQRYYAEAAIGVLAEVLTEGVALHQLEA